MRLSIIATLLLSALPFALSSPANLVLTVPPSLSALPASTRAYLEPIIDLTKANAHKIDPRAEFSVPVLRTNSFNVSAAQLYPALSSAQAKKAAKAGSPVRTWRLVVACRDYEFARYEIDVRLHGPQDTTKKDGEERDLDVEVTRLAPQGWRVKSDTTSLRLGGDATTNQGDEADVSGGGEFQLRALRVKEYYEYRQGFSPLSLLKNPMILIGVVGLGFVMFIPKLIENMDPEMRKEFEEHQKNSAFASGTAAASGQNPLQQFDLAGWMAGRSGTPVGGGSADAVSSGSGKPGGGGQARRRG